MAAATLSLLAAAAEDAPLLALVDDAQWLDAASREALLFAARRLANEGVVLVFGMREREWLRTAGITTLELRRARRGGRDRADRPQGVGIDPAVRSRVVSESQGNPLAILSALDQLTTEQLRGSAPIAHPLPVGAELETSFAQLLDGVPGRRALLIAAVSDTGASDEILRALAAAELSRADFEPAERAGLITVGAERVEFRHPLIRAAAYHRHDPVERRDAHRAYATALGPDPRAAWHLAAATAGPDEAVAAGLEAAAENALARSGYTAAGRAYESAAALSEDDHERLRRSLAAGRALWLGGEPERAAKLLESVLELATDPLTRADLQALRGAAQLFLRPPKETYELFVTEAERVLPHDGRARRACSPRGADLVPARPSRSTRASAPGARVAADGGAARRASVARSCSGACTPTAVTSPRRVRWLEPRRGCSSRPTRSATAASSIAPPPQALRRGSATGTRRMRLPSGSSRPRAPLAAPSVLPLALSRSAEFELRRGRVAASYAAATRVGAARRRRFGPTVESLVLARHTGARRGGARPRAACREHVAAARELCGATGANAIESYCGAVLGLLELACGRPGPRGRRHAREPASWSARWAWGCRASPSGLRTCGGARAQRRDSRGARGARRLEAEAERTGVPLGARGAPRAAAACSLEMTSRRRSPWRSRYGACRSSAPARCCASGCAAAARSAAPMPVRRCARRSTYFEAAGAEPWAEQARAELGAAGAPSVPNADSSLRALTPQELQVALSVATGITNREVAASLFLSEKTVEFHLSNVYRKLGLRSRAQLTRRIAGLP